MNYYFRIILGSISDVRVGASVPPYPRCDAGDTIVDFMRGESGSERPSLRFRAGRRNAVDVVAV